MNSRTTKPHQPHRGETVKVGRYSIMLGGTRDLKAEDVRHAEILVPLTESGLDFGGWYSTEEDKDLRYPGFPPIHAGPALPVLAAPLVDFGGVPGNWADFLKDEMIPLLKSRKRILAFCIGSHGRTGTLLASLIALLEPRIVDPIAAARRRHCARCVETRAQAKGVFALRDMPVPAHYATGFHR